jgi:hypothetical protein
MDQSAVSPENRLEVIVLSVISAQTPSALVARENRFPLFRIMLAQSRSKTGAQEGRLAPKRKPGRPDRVPHTLRRNIVRKCQKTMTKRGHPRQIQRHFYWGAWSGSAFSTKSLNAVT